MHFNFGMSRFKRFTLTIYLDLLEWNEYPLVCWHNWDSKWLLTLEPIQPVPTQRVCVGLGQFVQTDVRLPVSQQWTILIFALGHSNYLFMGARFSWIDLWSYCSTLTIQYFKVHSNFLFACGLNRVGRCN